MNDVFLRPRLTGSRFDEHTLPLDILKDFAALEEMLVEVAKRQYLAEHPGRQRTPKGFTSGLELHLSSVEEGSAIAVISLVFASLFPPNDAQYLERAKEQIVETIASVEQGGQASLPPELLRYFDRFGRALHDGEAIEFTRNNGQTTALTPATRQLLLQASQAEVWTEEVTFKGYIPEVDQADYSFELELQNGIKLKAPLLDAHRTAVLEASLGYQNKIMVAIKGVIQRDRAGRPKSFESVEHVTQMDPLDIETRLEELARLEDGWLDGKGLALNKDALDDLARAFDEHFSPDLGLPYLYPTPEGGVQAEWALGQWEVSLEIALPSMISEYQAVNIDTGASDELELSLATDAADDVASWKELNLALTQLQEGNV
ncbi:hypothetical protein [Aeromonas salmonicida]|uniref:hypothetical protein n=1 Tax=Aeromonas salmonicida TaxID=645 RepID=UPI00259E6443|nr:hypothetical protein [Aeromonas salmonicida]MDM5113585.1 hypothetical protein [Aeromonas salmonicida]